MTDVNTDPALLSTVAVAEKAEERLAYWRQAAKRDEPVPRDLEDLI